MSLQQTQIRRRIRLDSQDNEIGRIYSFTQAGRQTEYKTFVDIYTGHCSCSCPDWRCRGRKTGNACKHIRRHIAALIVKTKRGTIKLADRALAA